MPPLYGISFQQRGGVLMSLPCVRGGAARSAAEGLYPTQTIFFFFVLQSLSLYNPSGALAPAPFTQGSLFGLVRTLQADLRGVMRLWRCAPAPYRVCANIAGKHPVLRRWRRLPHGGNSYPPALTQSCSFLCFISFHTRFSLIAQAQRKANKRNAKEETRKRGLFEKIPLKIPQKLFDSCRRAFGVYTQSSVPAYQPHRKVAVSVRRPQKLFGDRCRNPCYSGNTAPWYLARINCFTASLCRASTSALIFSLFSFPLFTAMILA